MSKFNVGDIVMNNDKVMGEVIAVFECKESAEDCKTGQFFYRTIPIAGSFNKTIDMWEHTIVSSYKKQE